MNSLFLNLLGPDFRKRAAKKTWTLPDSWKALLPRLLYFEVLQVFSNFSCNGKLRTAPSPLPLSSFCELISFVWSIRYGHKGYLFFIILAGNKISFDFFSYTFWLHWPILNFLELAFFKKFPKIMILFDWLLQGSYASTPHGSHYSIRKSVKGCPETRTTRSNSVVETMIGNIPKYHYLMKYSSQWFKAPQAWNLFWENYTEIWRYNKIYADLSTQTCRYILLFFGKSF